MSRSFPRGAGVPPFKMSQCELQASGSVRFAIEGTVQRTPAVCPAVLVAKTRSVPDLPPCTCLKMSDVPGLMSPQLEYFICMTEGQPVCQSCPIDRLTVVYHDVTFLS